MKSEPEVIDEMKDLYVDDWATSFENTEEAFQNYKTAKEIMAEGSLNLRKWKVMIKSYFVVLTKKRVNLMRNNRTKLKVTLPRYLVYNGT